MKKTTFSAIILMLLSSSIFAADFSSHGFLRGKFTFEKCSNAGVDAARKAGWNPSVKSDQYVVFASSSDDITLQYTCVVDLGAYYIINGDKGDVMKSKFVTEVRKNLDIR